MSDSLGDRMKMYEKEFYSPELGYVNQNMPTFVRLDGKAFHTWVKRMNIEKPFDYRLSLLFQQATIDLCRDVGQILMAYGQSDEVTFLLNGWANPDSQMYFGGKIQKITSIMASAFTAHFNLKGVGHFDQWTSALFDARVFNVPTVGEIENVFIWRQQDAKRNSIQALARSLYSHSECNGKNQQEMVDMCYKKGILWDNLTPLQKWGFVVYKESYDVVVGDGMVERSRWVADTRIPYFVKDKRYIIEKWITSRNIGD